MPIKTFTSTTLSSADVNNYLMNQAVITCTSGTRPASPTTGMVIYETDTLRFRLWSGTVWVYPRPAGVVVSGTTDASGYLSVTHGLGWTPVAVVVTPNSPITAGGSSAIFGFALTDTFTSTTFRLRALAASAAAMASTAITASAICW